jgi:N-acetylneuraminic acid mutarotase
VFDSGTYNELTGILSIFDFVEVYDPDKDEWSSRRPMPDPRIGHAGVLGSDGKMYIMGGTSVKHGPPLKDVRIYDPIKDRWEKGPSMNCARTGLAAVSTPDGKIYAIGGTDVGAHRAKESANFLLPKNLEFYTGKVQDTVEVIDITD